MSKKKRNPPAKALSSDEFHQRVKPMKRRYLIDKLHEQEADEDLYEYFGIGKAPKE